MLRVETKKARAEHSRRERGRYETRKPLAEGDQESASPSSSRIRFLAWDGFARLSFHQRKAWTNRRGALFDAGVYDDRNLQPRGRRAPGGRVSLEGLPPPGVQHLPVIPPGIAPVTGRLVAVSSTLEPGPIPLPHPSGLRNARNSIPDGSNLRRRRSDRA